MKKNFLAIYNYKEGVKFLVGLGASVNAKNEDENQPIHLAAYKENISTIQFLVNKGADVHAKDERELQLIHLAAGESG